MGGTPSKNECNTLFPPEVIYTPGESKTVYVPGETLTVYTPGETKKVYVPGETKTVYTPGETKTVYVPGETKTKTVYTPTSILGLKYTSTNKKTNNILSSLNNLIDTLRLSFCVKFAYAFTKLLNEYKIKVATESAPKEEVKSRFISMFTSLINSTEGIPNKNQLITSFTTFVNVLVDSSSKDGKIVDGISATQSLIDIFTSICPNTGKTANSIDSINTKKIMNTVFQSGNGGSKSSFGSMSTTDYLLIAIAIGLIYYLYTSGKMSSFGKRRLRRR